MKILFICSESYGGFGGVAVYNQDMIDALAEIPFVESITMLPRLIREAPKNVPDKVSILSSGAGGIASFTAQCMKQAFGNYDLVLCSHINLLPFGKLCSTLLRCPLVSVLYGTEAWVPSDRVGVNRLVQSCDRLISISNFTTRRFQEWAKVPDGNVEFLPNAIHAEAYAVEDKDPTLLKKYGCENAKIVMTLGRLDARERQKGIDELIDLMPTLLIDEPDLKYLIVGDGDDRERLENKVRDRGLEKSVVFCGRVTDEDKMKHYQLADVFSMVGRQEGFGFVFLEAMACGIPVVASELDGSTDAVLGGKLGLLANPDKPETIRAAILKSLEKPREIPEGLSYYSFENFTERLEKILSPFSKASAKSDRAA